MEDGRNLLKILREHDASKGKPSVISIYTELMFLKKGINGITDYIIRAEAVITALRNAEETSSNRLLVAMTLKGLPKSFKLAIQCNVCNTCKTE